MLNVKLYRSVEKAHHTLMVVSDPENPIHTASAYVPSWYVRNSNELTLMLNTIHREYSWEWVSKLVQLLDRESF